MHVIKIIIDNSKTSLFPVYEIFYALQSILCFESISKTHNAQILKKFFESFDQLNTFGAMIDGCEFPKQRSLDTNLYLNGKQRKHIQY